MSMKTMTPVAASSVEVMAPTVTSPKKPPAERRSAKKTATIQGDAGVASGVAVPVTSNPDAGGFAAKKMPDDPAWIMLLHDLDTMTAMQLQTK